TNGLLTKIKSLNKAITLQYNTNNTLDNAIFSTGEKVSYNYIDGYLNDVKLYTKSGKISNHVQYNYENEKIKSVVTKNGLTVEFVFKGNRMVQTKTMRTTRVVNQDKTYPLKSFNSILEDLDYNLLTNKITVTTNSINEDDTSNNLEYTEFQLNEQGNSWKTKTIRTYHENEDPEIPKQDSNNLLIVTDYEQNQLMGVTDASGYKTTYERDAFGNVIKTHLPTVTVNGEKLNYILENKYNEKGQLTHSINTLGKIKEWKYNQEGNLTQIIDEEGNSQYFDYDSYGNLTKTKSDRGPLYSYLPDYSMEKTVITDWTIQGIVSKVDTKSKSGKRSIEISSNGILQSGEIPIKKGRLPVLALIDGLAPSGSVNTELTLQFLKDNTIIKESKRQYTFTNSWSKYRVNDAVPDDANELRVQIKNTGTEKIYVDDMVLEESNLETTYVYDSNYENIIEIKDPYGNKTSYTNNEYGLPLTETNSLNQTKWIEYNEELQVEKQIDREGRTKEYRYDENGNVIKEINSLGQVTDYQYNEWGQLIYTKLPTVKMTSYTDEAVDKVEEKQTNLYVEYDELGRKIRENDENGNPHSQEFDSYGRLEKVIDPKQNQKYYSYDKNGNIILTKDFAFKRDETTDETFYIANGETHATFDEWNRQITETDNTGNRNVLSMTNTYDSENRLVHTKDAEGTEIYYTFNALDENVYSKDNSNPTVETWTYYDGLGNAAITMSDNTIEYSVTDANGNVTESIDHKGTKTAFEYNSVGDKTKQINPDGSTVEWTYNKEGQIKSETQKVEDKSDTSTYLVTHFEYNNEGEVKYQKLEAKIVKKATEQATIVLVKETDLTYDELGRLIREYTKNYNQGTTQYKKSDIRFLYDLNGNLIHKWIYDESSESNINGTNYPYVRSESVYIYDENNRVISERKVENNITTWKEYKDDENTEVVHSALGETAIRYNENDLAINIKTPLSEEYDIEYLPSESINKIIGPRLTIDMDYGTNEKMTSIKVNKKDSETVIFSENYTYTSEEQIESATNKWDGQKSYTYTPEGFLKTVKKGTDTITYTYDVNGNLLKAVNQTGKVLVENQYGQGNRITTSIQYDSSAQKYKKVSYSFSPDGSLQKESYSLSVDTYEAAKQALIDVEKEYNYGSINLLLSIITKKGGSVVEKVEFTYDSEDNRTSKKVTNSEGERTEFYYYDSNGDLVSISEQIGQSSSIDNLLNFYRDASGQLLNFEYKGQRYDYVYNQRGDIVAITDELQEVIVRYTYDEWGNLEKIDAPTEIGLEIANANPYRYVGKFGVQYDKDTKLYFMGWRDYDSKIGRYIVADEYEGEDNNPISFNRYLYAEADPVNNIDPDGYLPKWLKKLSKGVKKGAKAAYNFAIGDDIKTLTSKKTKWYYKAGAAVSIASNFIPGGGIVSKVAKAAIKGTRKAVKAYKASKAVSRASKVVRSSAKKIASKVNKKPKTVHASSIRSTPKVESKAVYKVSRVTAKPKPKSIPSPKPARDVKQPRVVENKVQHAVAGDNIGSMLRSDGSSVSKGAGKAAIKQNEVTTYKDFVDRSVVGDNLEGHEVWQHANLKANGLATTRLSTEASKNNPVIALEREEHKLINKAQRGFDAANQLPIDNIMSNSKILREAGISEDIVNDITSRAIDHMKKTLK
ncbi:RHS repeat-associated core domain-containing protein, partial [Gottfriedia acidiceleris]|uniref:RHS repeat-associated core domain-containing protein n=1 Tax=Gottfriedia acidiceleris TaxID=371036 RepID=UPI003393FF66